MFQGRAKKGGYSNAELRGCRFCALAGSAKQNQTAIEPRPHALDGDGQWVASVRIALPQERHHFPQAQFAPLACAAPSAPARAGAAPRRVGTASCIAWSRRGGRCDEMKRIRAVCEIGVGGRFDCVLLNKIYNCKSTWLWVLSVAAL